METDRLLIPHDRATDDELRSIAGGIQWELEPPPPPTLPFEDDVEGLINRIIDLTVERDTYAALAKQAIAGMRDLQIRHDRQQQRYLQLRDECARLRGKIAA